MKNWIDRKLKESQSKPLLRLFLLGLKGQISSQKSKPYNFYPRLISAVLSVAFAKWLTDLYTMQIDVRGYNWLIPDYIYKVRQESHIYWQVARLARKMPTTFSYYKWGDNLMFQITRKGEQIPFHSHSAIENVNTFQSFLHQYNFPASPERHAQIMMYLKNINNPYDMGNYLRYKSVNMGDWMRAFYYMVYRELGLTNRWRYDEYVSKPPVYYSWQKIKYAFLLSKDRKQLYECFDKIQLKRQEIIKFFIWFY